MLQKKTLGRKILLAKYIKYNIWKSAKLNEDDRIRVVMIGDGAVGKSAITTYFIQGKFNTEYDPTIDDFYRKEIQVNNFKSIIEVIDLAGPEEYYSVRESHWRSGDCFIIVCDVNNRDSLEEAKILLHQLVVVKNSTNFPVVFALNKIDLLEYLEKEKIVEEYKRDIESTTCLYLGNSSILDCSARTGENINYLFDECVRRTRFNSIGNLKLLKDVIKYDSNFIEICLNGNDDVENNKKKAKKCFIM